MCKEVPYGDGYICQCPENFSGFRCEIKLKEGCFFFFEYF